MLIGSGALFGFELRHTGPQSADCLSCHSDASLTKEVNGKRISLQAKGDSYKNSVHGQMFQSVDCHQDIKPVPHDSKLAKPNCAQCHEEAQKLYDGSLHAKAIAAGNAKAARCVSIIVWHFYAI